MAAEQSQVRMELFDELARATLAAQQLASHKNDARDDHDKADFEAFQHHWHQLKAKHSEREFSQRRARWHWIEEMQGMCVKTCSEFDSLVLHLNELEGQRQEVIRKTTALHQQCEQMVADQERLSGTAEALAERLDVFDRVADIARVLDQGNAATSHPDFGAVLEQLDTSIAFLEAHYDFSQAKAYLHQFEHLRNRACITLRSALQKSLEKSAAQVDQQLRDRSRERTVDTQVFYARFKAAAPNYKPLMVLLSRRVDTHETYSTTLEELEGFFAHLRIRLLSSPVTAHLQTLLHKDLSMSQLAPATRSAATYVLDIAGMERQCFEAYFELRQPQEALRLLQETIADIFYKTLRPVVLSCDSVDSLREMADCLHMDILEPNQQSSSSGQLMSVLNVTFRLHKDVQEKLIFRAQKYIQDEIRGYQLRALDADYPCILFRSAQASAKSEAHAAQEFQHGWFPTMKNTLGILAKIHRVVEMTTFQGLAQEAVDVCIGSLKQTAQLLAQRALPQRSNPLSTLVQMLDSQLFLIKHLLILREQVAAFECDLVVSERHFEFSNFWEALQLKLPDGLLGILKPKVHYTQVDSKKDIESELKGACELLITSLTAQLVQPIAVLNSELDQFLSTNDRSTLSAQSFMAADRVTRAVESFKEVVKSRIPFAAAHIRLYLSTPGGSGDEQGMSVQSTASILFKPVQIRLVDAWTRLTTVLQEALTAEQVRSVGVVLPDRLQEEVGDLFGGVMLLPWGDLVKIVEQVPRTISQSRSDSRSMPQGALAPAQVPPATEVPSPGPAPAEDSGPPCGESSTLSGGEVRTPGVPAAVCEPGHDQPEVKFDPPARAAEGAA